MCSIAQASIPSAAPVCHVAIDASRSAVTSASPCASSAHGIHASTMFGAGESVLKVISGDDAERPFRPDEEIDEVHAGRGVISGRSLRDVRHAIRRHRHGHAPARRLDLETAMLAPAAPPAASSSTVPSARTTVSASTQSRVLPYLKVAAPAAFVATMPPAKAPVKVGTGGNHAPASVEPFLHRRDRDAGLDRDQARPDVDDARHLRRREDHLAHRRRAAGQRGLGADRQNR